MREDIGIGIIDVYGQDDLNLCYDSLPEVSNIIIASDTNNKLPDCKHRRYGNGVPFATLRNYIIHQFRLDEKIKHIFIISSNQIIKDKNIFEKTISTAETFGTWAMTGPEKSVLSIEDDVTNSELKISDKVNPNFLYLFNGIISNVGFFDERYYNTDFLDVLDYIERMRLKKVYPSKNYNPIIDTEITVTNTPIKKPNFKDGLTQQDRSVELSYGFFMYNHKYIPNQNDQKSIERDVLMQELEDLQKNYGKK
jgi:hypothetical protein